MTKNIVTGIDIGTSSIRVVVCEYDKNSDCPNVLSFAKKPSRGLRRGYIINFDETVANLKEVIQEAEREAKIKIKRALVGVGGVTMESRFAEGSVAVSRADLEITKNDIKRTLDEAENNLHDMNNRAVLHRFPVSFKVDGKKVLGQPEEMTGSKIETKALFVTCSKQHLKDFIRAVEEAGVIVEDVVASPLASSSLLLPKIQKASGCALANIGSQTTSIVIFEEGQPLSLHIFPIGSTDITNDIALGFKIPLEEAEQIKKREVEPIGPKKKLDEIIEARVFDIFELIEVHLKKIGRNGLLPAGIVITGGGSNIINVADLAKNYFKLPARVAAPTCIYNNQTAIDTSWSVAYGLCVYSFGQAERSDYLESESNQIKEKFIHWLKEFMP